SSSFVASGKGADPASPSSATVRRFDPYEAAATLLSTQVRGIVERSIETFVSFFQRFRTTGQSRRCWQAKERCWSGVEVAEDAFLRVGLKANGGDISFTTPLEQVEDSLVHIFREFVVSLRGLERPDVKLGRWHGKGQRNLWDVSLDERHVKHAEELVAETVRLNLANLEQTLGIYDDFKHLLVEVARVRKLSENVTLTREDYMREVEKLRATEHAIRTHCASEIRLQMVLIDCSEINETLCQKADE
ncbi:unnamed protein product, partial [Polarella glacialis]